jgi:hypothetical protein
MGHFSDVKCKIWLNFECEQLVYYQPVGISSWDFWVQSISGSERSVGVSVSCLGSGSLNLGQGSLVINWKFEQSLHSTMENGFDDGQWSMDLQDDDFMDFQCLVISVNALHLKVSFILDTLIIHRDMVDQLQDEVAIRSQVEEM